MLSDDGSTCMYMTLIMPYVKTLPLKHHRNQKVHRVQKRKVK